MNHGTHILSHLWKTAGYCAAAWWAPTLLASAIVGPLVPLAAFAVGVVASHTIDCTENRLDFDAERQFERATL